MRRASILAVLVLATLAGAQETTVSGFLMDKSCVNMKMEAATHGKDCALMEDCMKSGYGVVTADGKFVAFDKASNKTAMKWLETTGQKTGLKVSATGKLKGGVLTEIKLK
jgi:hypothetical protein